jgi:hypothetical protein
MEEHLLGVVEKDGEGEGAGKGMIEMKEDIEGVDDGGDGIERR